MTCRYRFISEHAEQYNVARLCRVLDVHRSGYTRWAGAAGVPRAAATVAACAPAPAAAAICAAAATWLAACAAAAPYAAIATRPAPAPV